MRKDVRDAILEILEDGLSDRFYEVLEVWYKYEDINDELKIALINHVNPDEEVSRYINFYREILQCQEKKELKRLKQKEAKRSLKKRWKW